jgi:predicted HicB family RNase H-like nuclease
MPEKTKRFFVRIDPDLHQAAHARAAKQGHTLSDVIRALLIWWIKSGKDVKDLEK